MSSADPAPTSAPGDARGHAVDPAAHDADRSRAEAADRRAEAALERMRVLDDIYRAAVTQDVQGLVEVIAERVAALFGGPCSIHALDPGGALVMRTIASPAPDEQAFGRSLMPVVYPADPPAVPAWLAGEPVLASRLGPGDLAAMSAAMAPAVRPYLERHPVESLVSAPLHDGGAVVGRLTVVRSEGHGTPFTHEDRDLLVAIADRASLVLGAAAARAAAMATAERLRLLLAQSPIATVTIDPAFRVTFWNEAAEALFGWSAEAVVGGRPPIVPADLEAETLERWASVFRGERVVGIETRRMARGDREVPVALYDTPLVEPDGTVGGAVLRMVDLTERRRFAERLAQASRLASIGRLAGGIAHDFRNILQGVQGNASLIADDPIHPDVLPFAQAILEATERADAIVGKLLAFAGDRTSLPHPVSPAAVLADLRSWARIPASIELRVSVEPDAGRVMGDEAELTQVILNLVSNAVDAMPAGGRLSILLGRWNVEDDSLLEQHGLGGGDYVRLAVTDTGVGMDAAAQANAFDPYYTTKEVGKGSGLGLATVHGIVERMDGRVWLYSQPGRGSSFHVYLPRLRDVDGLPVPAPPAEPAVQRPVVLLVEDDPWVRRAAELALRRRGYELLIAADGQEAIDRWEAAGRPVLSLLLTDVEMPRLSGTTLALTLRRNQPKLPVIATSGFPRDQHEALEELAGDPAPYRYLTKPYTVQRLWQAVDEVIREAAG